jgi:hypothetical protein
MGDAAIRVERAGQPMSNINKISKRDAFSMTDQQRRAGVAMERTMRSQGRFATSSMSAEDTAPKTWILWKNSAKGEEIHTIECEIHSVPRASDPSQQVCMLIGMCPLCYENFTVREDNKTMTIDWLAYAQLKSIPHLKVNWDFHCKNTLARAPKATDKVAVVGSPERWLCDYCHGWCVKVTDSIAITDMTGATQLYSHAKAGSAIVEPGAATSTTGRKIIT